MPAEGRLELGRLLCRAVRRCLVRGQDLIQHGLVDLACLPVEDQLVGRAALLLGAEQRGSQLREAELCCGRRLGHDQLVREVEPRELVPPLLLDQPGDVLRPKRARPDTQSAVGLPGGGQF